MATTKYEEFDAPKPFQNPSENIQRFPDLSQPQPPNNNPNFQQNMPPLQMPVQEYPPYQQPNYLAGNLYAVGQPMAPIMQNQMPPPLSYGIPIDVRQTMRTVPVTRYSETLFCFNCQRMVPTQVFFTSGAGTWTSALIVAMVGCFLGCCLIPFCIEDCQDAKHVCSSCGCELGKKRFLFS